MDWLALIRPIRSYAHSITSARKFWVDRRSCQSSEARIESHFGVWIFPFDSSLVVFHATPTQGPIYSMPVAYRTRSQAVAVIADHTASQHSRLLRLLMLTHSALVFGRDSITSFTTSHLKLNIHSIKTVSLIVVYLISDDYNMTVMMMCSCDVDDDFRSVD